MVGSERGGVVEVDWLCKDHAHITKDVGCWICRAQGVEQRNAELRKALNETQKVAKACASLLGEANAHIEAK